jgi:hypothetical protein
MWACPNISILDVTKLGRVVNSQVVDEVIGHWHGTWMVRRWSDIYIGDMEEGGVRGNGWWSPYITPPFKGTVSQHMRISRRSLGLLWWRELCKGTSVRFLTSPILLYPPLLSPCSYVLPSHLCTISRNHTQRPMTFALTVCKGNPNSLREQLSLKINQGESKVNI